MSMNDDGRSNADLTVPLIDRLSLRPETSDQVAIDFELLNELYQGSSRHWRPSVVKKNWIDMFGQEIAEGEMCYIREIRENLFDPPWRISERSMEALLAVLFAYNPFLFQTAKLLKEQARKKIFERLHSTETRCKTAEEPSVDTYAKPLESK